MESEVDPKTELIYQEHICPACFGDQDQVFQEKQKGIIKPHDDCLPCVWVRKCFRQALRVGGTWMPPVQDNSSISRITGFLKRWSSRKAENLKDSDRNGRK